MAYQSVDQAPLLPASLRDWLGQWLLRAMGSAMLLACTICGIALLTWSAADPSLTHAISGPVRNLLGPPGAILADLLMQLIGLASVAPILPLLLWGLQLSTGHPLGGWRSKLFVAPLGIAALAGALAYLPTAARWPLHHGIGGLFGDLVLTFLAGVLAPLAADKAGMWAFLLLFLGGAAALLGCLGLSRQDWLQILERDGQAGAVGLGRLCRTILVWLPSRRPPNRTAVESARANMHEPPMYRTDRAGPLVPLTEMHETAAPDFLPAPTGANVQEEVGDASSRAIAERFAPAGKQKPEPSLPDGPPPVRRKRDDDTWARTNSPGYRRPPLNILKRPPAAKAGDHVTQSALLGHARLLADVLADFGIKGEIKGAHPGPVVTLFEFEPARGTKSARVIGLADDIARSMSAVSVRVAVVPGRNVIGIELPNPRRDKVYLRELIEDEAFRTSSASLPLVLGKNIAGAPVFADLARMPHLLVAGTTGAGKSVGVNAMILSLLYRLPPEECRFLMIDPKMLELSVYNGIPHLLCPVVTDPHKAVAALNWVVREMEQRYERMSKMGVRNIDSFNARAKHAKRRGAGAEDDSSPLPYIVVVVDEFADLMLVAGKEIESAVQRLAQMARAAGIHLIMATQRPSVDVITGTIKANFPTRISFKVASKFDSRTILNDQGAEQLLGQGDMLFSGGADRLMRVHGPFVSDEEVEGIAGYLREQGDPHYIMGITDTPETDAEEAADSLPRGEDLYDRAVGIVLRDGKPSISYLQRRLSIGYNRAASLIERMEHEGIVSPMGEGGRRQVLLGARPATSEAW